jgi:predicted hydrocarbon binding protein
MSKISILDAVKIQATALIPVVKALEAELGKERAHSIVGRAIAEAYAELRAARSPDRNTHPGEVTDGPEFPVESEIVDHTRESYGFDITGCAFADHFREIGEPEIGALLTCGVDFAVERKLRPEWEFRRTQTRMQGAPHCDFRWRLRGSRPSGD